MHKKFMNALMVMAIILPLATTGAFAAEYMEMFEVEKVNQIEYVSGGVGKGERDALQKMEKNFDVKFVFALDDGNYLSKVVTVIEDSGGKELLHTVSNGPWLYAKLPGGAYTVSAVHEDEKMTRKVKVDNGGLQVVRFTW
jgi:hypothetical protein